MRGRHFEAAGELAGLYWLGRETYKDSNIYAHL